MQKEVKSFCHGRLYSIYVPKDELIGYVKQDLTLKEISEKFNMSVDFVINRLKKYKVSVPHKHIRYKLDIPYTKLVEEYNSGCSVPELATKYKVSTTYIKVRIRENGGVIRTKKQAQILRYQRERMEITS